MTTYIGEYSPNHGKDRISFEARSTEKDGYFVNGYEKLEIDTVRAIREEIGEAVKFFETGTKSPYNTSVKYKFETYV